MGDLCYLHVFAKESAADVATKRVAANLTQLEGAGDGEHHRLQC